MGTFPDEFKRLVEQFHQQSDRIRTDAYNETQVRIDFIDPMMKSLGWDMNNAQGFAEQYREVVHEDRIKVGGQTKAPDYSFRIGGTRKFFLEAKKPSVNVKTDVAPAYQLRRYAWSAKLAVSLLTDFEEFAVYDTRTRPKELDKASDSRREYLRYTEYENRWDFVSGTFSKDAVLRGEFDRYCETKKGRGAQAVDEAFLDEIEGWRKLLANNLAIRNKSLDEGGLNFATQRILDRIIFLRIAEDRGTEAPGQLQSLLKSDDVYRGLVTLFNRADERYNSGLFHFAKEKNRDEAHDALTPTLDVDDRVLKNVVRALYYPQSPYEFSMLSADILGSVYERFLGKVITLGANHTARIDEKPEVRKAGGVYYTPTYIVDYIVRQTVGKLLENRGMSAPLMGAAPPPEHERGARATTFKPPTLKILDPACGSGSFLIGAYQFLLDWYLDRYTRDLYPAPNPEPRTPNPEPRVKNALLRPTPTGGWALTIAERKRILLDHIYGVDLDGQAVEVTKLNLLLKCLEGETSATLGFEQRLFRERALPDLGKNVLCGNSLIGTDIMATDAWKGMSDEEKTRMNPFDYERAFPNVFKGKDGGFDVVIGNPPWGAELATSTLAYCAATFATARTRNPDTYALFIERGSEQLRPKGRLGYITPDTFLRKDDHLRMRSWMLENVSIDELVETGPVFSQVRDTWCLIFVILRDPPTSARRITHRKISRFTVSAEDRLRAFARGEFSSVTHVRQSIWHETPKRIVGYLATEAAQAIISRISKHPSVGDECDEYAISRGEEGSKLNIAESDLGDFQMVIPEDVERYRVNSGRRVFASTLTKRKIESIYRKPKLWVIRIQKMRWRQRIVCGIDFRTTSCAMKTLQSIVCLRDDGANSRLHFIQGIFASRLVNFWCINFLADDMNGSYLARVPVPREVSAEVVSSVESMLALHKRLAAEQLPQRKEQIQREIDATDRQIDQLVYALYDLTADEVAIVEAATA